MNKKENNYILIWAKKIKSVNLLGGKCEKCGCTDVRILEFHHIDPNKKEFTICDIRNLRWSIIEREIQKCILLCSNCHSILHDTSNLQCEYRKFSDNKKILLEYLKIDKCQKCGIKVPNSVLHFHHLDSSLKKFQLSKGIKITLNTVQDLNKNIIDEINKCEILCSNCHRLEHTEQLFNKFKDDIYKRVNEYKETKKTNHEEVFKLYENGMKKIDIAKKLGVNKTVIGYIINKKYIEKIIF